MSSFNKENTIAVTGLRKYKLCWDTQQYNQNEQKMIDLLEQYLEKYINKGFVNFLSGMANGSDIIFAKAVINLKNKYPHILLHGIIPFLNQNKYYSNEDKKIYDDLIKKCDTIRIISVEYSANCYKIRNEFLVKNSSVLLAITYNIEMHRSGTTQTINMAIKNGVGVVKVDPQKFEITNIV